MFVMGHIAREIILLEAAELTRYNGGSVSGLDGRCDVFLYGNALWRKVRAPKGTVLRNAKAG